MRYLLLGMNSAAVYISDYLNILYMHYHLVGTLNLFNTTFIQRAKDYNNCQPELVGTSIIDVMPINESTIGTVYDG